jgi:hypothetical protein
VPIINFITLTYQVLTLNSKILNNGDTMTGDSNMSGYLVKDLFVNYRPTFVGNEAAGWAQALELVTDATLPFQL